MKLFIKPLRTTLFVLITIIVCLGFAQAQDTGLFYRAYPSQGALNSPTLVLVLHGDSPFRNPSYQYAIARRIASENSNVVAVGILRPGYTDEEGKQSPGERGDTSGDNYTQEVMNAIKALTTKLKTQYSASKVVLVGHSGGAAISANLLSKNGCLLYTSDAADE